MFFRWDAIRHIILTVNWVGLTEDPVNTNILLCKNLLSQHCFKAGILQIVEMISGHFEGCFYFFSWARSFLPSYYPWGEHCNLLGCLYYDYCGKGHEIIVVMYFGVKLWKETKEGTLHRVFWLRFVNSASYQVSQLNIRYCYL